MVYGTSKFQKEFQEVSSDIMRLCFDSGVNGSLSYKTIDDQGKSKELKVYNLDGLAVCVEQETNENNKKNILTVIGNLEKIMQYRAKLEEITKSSMRIKIV